MKRHIFPMLLLALYAFTISSCQEEGEMDDPVEVLADTHDDDDGFDLDEDDIGGIGCGSDNFQTVTIADTLLDAPGKVRVDDKMYWNDCQEAEAFFDQNFDVTDLEQQLQEAIPEGQCPENCPVQKVTINGVPVNRECRMEVVGEPPVEVYTVELKFDYQLECLPDSETQVPPEIFVPEAPQAPPTLEEGCEYSGHTDVGWICWNNKWIHARVFTWICDGARVQRLKRLWPKSESAITPCEGNEQFDAIPELQE